MLAEHRLEELGHELLHLSRTDGWDQMAACIDDDVVRLFAAVGRHDELPATVVERFGGLTDAINLTTPKSPAASIPADLIHELQAVESPFRGFA